MAAKSGALIGTRARTGAPVGLVVKIAKSASLSGSIRDMKTQSPVAGAYVSLRVPMRMDPGQTWSAITDGAT